jgi:ABC-type polysaccharide/polyol phosphate export permease
MSSRSEVSASYSLSAARPGPLQLLNEAWDDLLSRRRLIGYLVRADMKKKGADTILGNVWWVLDPLLQMLVYVVLVAIILGARIPDYPLFIFAAILPWKWFSSSIGDAIVSISSQDRLIKQLKFPKIVLPTAAVGAGLVSFAFGLLALAGLLAFLYRDRIAWTLVLIPAIAVVQFVFTFALALGLAALNVFYRDVGNVSRHILRLWFYLSPGLWGAAQLDQLAATNPVLVDLARLNPFYWLFTAYRAVIYDGTPPDWTALAVVLLVSIVLAAVAAVLFKRVEPSFAKVL